MFRKLLTLPGQMWRAQRPHRPMWRNFFEALALLSIAMMSALYSSGAAHEGRVVDAAVAALLALGLAFWVALRFLPRLARGVDWSWIPFSSRYHVTREGWIYFGAVGIVILAAINTSNNLLYMVLAGMLAVLLLSELLSAMNFRFLAFDLSVPPNCFAGKEFPFSIRMRNGKHIFPAFSVEATVPHHELQTVDRFEFPFVVPSGHANDDGNAVCAKRGRHMLETVRISTRYPFGFFSKERNYDVAAECVAFPAILPAEQLNLSGRDLHGSTERPERGLGHDLHAIREYLPFDSARHVHWKASARTGSLKTREYAAEESRKMTIIFDRYGSPESDAAFEELVSRAASMAFHLTQDGVEVSFVSDDWRTPHANSGEQLEAILTYLALVPMAADAPLPDEHADAGSFFSLRGGGAGGSE